jgi:hypothetical protein
MIVFFQSITTLDLKLFSNPTNKPLQIEITKRHLQNANTKSQIQSQNDEYL